MSQPKAALIEVYDSHVETVYSQLRFLQASGYDVTLIISEKHRDTVACFEGVFAIEFVAVAKKRGLAQWKELWRIRRIILERGITTAIFNTAHSNPVRNFCLLPFPKKVRFCGTLHGVNKLRGSFTQRIISRRIRHYFLLSDYMLEKAMKVPHGRLSFCVYYPIFHPPFAAVPLPQRPPGECWIAMPGAVEYKRRDYLSLAEALAAMKDRPRLRFFLLGNGSHPAGNGADLQRRLKDSGLESMFVFFEGFVPDEVLHSYVRHCDAVMPLIHPVNADMEKYLENQISGAFPLAFAYRKPLLMHEYYRRYQDFRETSLFYSLDSLSEFLSTLPHQLSGFDADEAYANPKWRFEYQRSHYADFLSEE